MYHTTTTGTIVAGGTITPVVGAIVAERGADAPVAAVAQGPRLVTAGADVLGSTDVVEVLGVKFVNDGGNPLVDAARGVADGTLPFTGTAVLFLALTAITLILLGLSVIRISRNLATPSV